MSDLIHREALKKILKEKCCGDCRMCDDYCIFENGVHRCSFIDNAPTVDIQTAVMELYKRYQPRLATNVYEFGVELEELLGRYERSDEE